MQQQQQQQQPASLEQLHNIALNIVEAVCSIIAMPVEIIIRWQYGTRYFPIPVVFFSAMLMVLLPLFSSVADSVTSMIPFHSARPPAGLFSLGAFSSLYFFLSFLHGLRIWRRMVHMELEDHSRWEGPPLPFFRLVPWSRSHWLTRIVMEPLFLYIGATVLEHAFIFQSGLATYVRTAAIALVMKHFIVWYRAWEFMRDHIDNANIAPIVASLLQNKATDQELAKVHLVTFPKAPPELRQSAASRIARAFSANDPQTSPVKEGNL